MRIVSLVPSLTETLSAWGRAPIACTRFCERPDLEQIGGTKNPNVARVAALEPDLVVMDEEENRREDYDALVAGGLEVFVSRVRSLQDVDTFLATLAARVDATWEPLALGDAAAPRLRAFVPIWRRPWTALGTPTYGASLLAHLGVENVFDGDGPYPTIELNAVRERHPDVVLAPSEPYPFGARQREELETVAPTTFLDGQDLFWWGQRTAAALTRLESTLAPLKHARNL
jgi:ABC-type Fe3+-hydroxamate transport system substrate-binding protein